MASHLIGDMSGATLDDPLSDRYSKLNCSISLLDKESDDYKMILKYLDKTYEPVKVGEIVSMKFIEVQSKLVSTAANLNRMKIVTDQNAFQEYGMSVENIFVIESNAGPSLDEIKKLSNKFLLWCGKMLSFSLSENILQSRTKQ